MKLSAIISLSTALLLLALSASCKKGGEGGELVDDPICFTSDASVVEEYNATLNGYVPKYLANAHGLRAWFLWSQSEDTVEWLKYRGDKVETDIRPDGTFSHKLANLNQATTYYYTAVVLYNGTQYYGEVKSFMTTDVNKNLTFKAEAVDLGLPSGLLWSKFNLGAEVEEGYGAYYAWGELEPKNDNFYDYAHYKWCEGSDDTMTKYCIREDWGKVDNILQLEPEDDVVAVKLGDGWRMPTKAEQDELRAYCTWKWTTRNGVPGCEVTSTINEATLFFPAAGAKVGFGGPGSSFSSWSSTLSIGHSRFASVLCGDGMSFTEGGAYRCHGHTVRPVKEGKNF